jgi:hypothetical protein
MLVDNLFLWFYHFLSTMLEIVMNATFQSFISFSSWLGSYLPKKSHE